MMSYKNNSIAWEKKASSTFSAALILAAAGTSGTYSSLANAFDDYDNYTPQEEHHLLNDNAFTSTYSEIIGDPLISRTGVIPKEHSRVLVDNELEFIDETLKIITGLDFIEVDPVNGNLKVTPFEVIFCNLILTP